jgi:flagellar protein FlgJ
MFDQQIAQQLSKKGIGIASMLVKQLSGALPPAAAPSESAAAAPSSTSLEKARSALAQRASAVSGSAAWTPVKDAPVAQPKAPAAGAALGSVGEAVQSFVEKLRPYAEAVAQKLGVPAHYLIAQAGLETGWGRSQPKAADGTPSNNLFGIKATSSWKGSSVAATTTEYTAGQAEKTTAAFRSYGSYSDSLQDFANLLSKSRRYANALSNTHDAGKYAASLQEAGYATDPRYAEKLTRAIQLVARYSPAAPQVAQVRADNRPDQA